MLSLSGWEILDDCFTLDFQLSLDFCLIFKIAFCLRFFEIYFTNPMLVVCNNQQDCLCLLHFLALIDVSN